MANFEAFCWGHFIKHKLLISEECRCRKRPSLKTIHTFDASLNYRTLQEKENTITFISQRKCQMNERREKKRVCLNNKPTKPTKPAKPHGLT